VAICKSQLIVPMPHLAYLGPRKAELSLVDLRLVGYQSVPRQEERPMVARYHHVDQLDL
jgi:hypothetical protein